MRLTLSVSLLVSVVTTIMAGAGYYAVVTGSPRCNVTETSTPLKITVSLLQESGGKYYLLANTTVHEAENVTLGAPFDLMYGPLRVAVQHACPDGKEPKADVILDERVSGPNVVFAQPHNGTVMTEFRYDIGELSL